MRYVHAAFLSLAVWFLGGSLQAQPAGNNRPQAPETFTKDVLDAVRELTVAVKAIPTTVHIETSWNLGNNAVVGIAIFSVSLVVATCVAGCVLAIIVPRRQA